MVGNQLGQQGRGTACGCRVGAAGQRNGQSRAHHKSGAAGTGQVFELLGQHVGVFQVGRHQDVGAPRHAGFDVLDARRTLRATRFDALAAQAEFSKAYAVWLAATELDDINDVIMNSR